MNSAFIEKIMTITAAVNGCVSCTWFHARKASHSGINEEEVKNMRNLQLQSDAAEFETMALLFT